MRCALLTVLAICAPMMAAALSCTPHSVQAAYHSAEADEARFIVVRGVLDFDAGQLPEVDFSNQDATPDMTRIPAQLNGHSLSGAGFKTPYAHRVTLEVACFGPWCAQPKSGDVVAFVELRESGSVVATDPCGGYLFGPPTPSMIRAIKRCFAGVFCTPPR